MNEDFSSIFRLRDESASKTIICFQICRQAGCFLLTRISCFYVTRYHDDISILRRGISLKLGKIHHESALSSQQSALPKRCLRSLGQRLRSHSDDHENLMNSIARQVLERCEPKLAQIGLLVTLRRRTDGPCQRSRSYISIFVIFTCIFHDHVCFMANK